MDDIEEFEKEAFSRKQTIALYSVGMLCIDMLAFKEEITKEQLLEAVESMYNIVSEMSAISELKGITADKPIVH